MSRRPAQISSESFSTHPSFTRGPVYELPVEVLRLIFRHIPALSVDSTGAVAPCFASYSQVCSYWHNVAIRTPELWSHIPRGLNAPWITTYLNRSGTLPLTLHTTASVFLDIDLFYLLSDNLPRVCDFSLDMCGDYDELWDGFVETWFQWPAPELTRIELLDSKYSSDYRWLNKGLFTYMPKLHTLVLRRGFDIQHDYSLLSTIQHLHLDTIMFHQHILLILKHAPVLETLSFDMSFAGDILEVVQEVMEKLEGKLPVVLPNLTFFEIPSALVTDFALIFNCIEFPSPPRWFVRFCVDVVEVIDPFLVIALYILGGYVRGRRDIGDIISDLCINFDHHKYEVRGWSSGALLQDWHRAHELPARNPKLSTFDFSLEYTEKHDLNGEVVNEPDLDHVILFAGRLPLDDVKKLWISAPEDARNLALYIVRRWLKLLVMCSSLRALTLSWGAAVGVLSAYIGSRESKDKMLPVEVYGAKYAEATFPNVSELILVRQTAQETSYPSQLDRILYRFLQLRHNSGTPLQVLRHDLCSGVCGSGGDENCNSLAERFRDLVEGEIHCTKCGRTFRKGTSFLSLWL